MERGSGNAGFITLVAIARAGRETLRCPAEASLCETPCRNQNVIAFRNKSIPLIINRESLLEPSLGNLKSAPRQ
jgi:hypothetical protein